MAERELVAAPAVDAPALLERDAELAVLAQPVDRLREKNIGARC